MALCSPSKLGNKFFRINVKIRSDESQLSQCQRDYSKLLIYLLQSLWSGVYLRWVVDQSVTKETWNSIADLKQKEKEMKREALKLRKQLIEMDKALSLQLNNSVTPT